MGKLLREYGVVKCVIHPDSEIIYRLSDAGVYTHCPICEAAKRKELIKKYRKEKRKEAQGWQ